MSPGFWRAIFGNELPVAVEIGPGLGEFLAASAARDGQSNFFAIERSQSRARSTRQQLEVAGLTNARVISAPATCALELLPDECVTTYYVNFPDPWWKRRHHRRRLWTAAFVATLRRTLVPGGKIELITDVADTFALAQRFLNADQGLEAVTAATATVPTTSFARKAHRRGAAFHTSVHRRKAGRPQPCPRPASGAKRPARTG